MKACVRRRSSSQQRGLSLIEILVGLAIGIIGILAIFQTVGIWNRHTQSTSAGGDAQVAGTLALFDIERDFKQSGHGFGEAPVPVMGCTVQATDTSGRGAFTFNLRPVDIVVGAGGAPDDIFVLHGSSSFFVEGQNFLSSTPTSKTLQRRGGFKPGDLVVAADAGTGLPGTANCSLAEITADTNPDLLTVDHAAGSYTSFYPPSATASRFDPPGGLAFPYVSGVLYDLGPTPQLIHWQVAGSHTLQRSELIFNPPPTTPEQPVADGVVNLKAEYGVDVDGDTIISPGEWSATLPAGSNWNQVLAVRVAILVRSRQFERTGDPEAGNAVAVTAAAPTYFQDTVSPTGKPFTMFNVDGGADSFGGGGANTPDPLNWRFYRYRVYERVIPLRNVLWVLP